MLRIIGKKIVMTQFFTKIGQTYASTVIRITPCFITNLKFKEIDGYNAIQIGYELSLNKSLTRPINGICEKNNLIPLKYKKEFSIENPNNFRIGQTFDTLALLSTKNIAIQSKTIGKGFCGVRKRYQFSTGPLSHGSKSHRQPGAIGQGTTPGRVFKGKKLAGNSGNKKIIILNLQILQINTVENLLIVKGNCAGKKNTFLTIKPYNQII